MTELQVCKRCRNGVHSHDRYTDTGADAGCPFLVEPGGAECQCPAVVHQARPAGARPHCQTCTCHAASR